MYLIFDHPALVSFAAFWIFSAFVGGMPDPTEKSSPGYVWMHSSLHILAGNLTAAMQTKYPQLPAGTTINSASVTQVKTPCD